MLTKWRIIYLVDTPPTDKEFQDFCDDLQSIACVIGIHEWCLDTVLIECEANVKEESLKKVVDKYVGL